MGDEVDADSSRPSYQIGMARNQFEMVKDISYIKLGVCTGECPEFLEDYTNLYNQMTEWQAKNVISE